MITVDQHLFQPSLKEKEKQHILILDIFVNLGFAVVETFAAILTNSVSLFSKGVHDFGDAFALSITYVAQKFLLKPPTEERSFGNLRITILAAFFNALALFVVTGLVFVEAFERIKDPQPVPGLPLIILAVVGVVVNGIISYRLFGKREDVDAKSIFFHSLEDSLGALGVLIAGVVIQFTNFYLIDSIISILIGLIVLYGAFKVSYEAIQIFLEGTPRGVNIKEIQEGVLSKFKEVQAMHDIHIWVLGPGRYALSAHLAVDDMTITDSRLLLNRVKNLMRNKFNIWHTAFELECPSCLLPWDKPTEQK